MVSGLAASRRPGMTPLGFEIRHRQTRKRIMLFVPPANVRTTCPYCGVGCGVLVGAGSAVQGAEVQGDPAHPANAGRLCSKGYALGETLGVERRLLVPDINSRRA